MKNNNYKQSQSTDCTADQKSFPELSPIYRDPHNYPVGVAYLDKQYVPISQARISVLDQGFLHSDATYDVMHAWRGRLFRPQLYLERFFNGLAKLKMTIPYSREEVLDIVLNAIALSGLQDAYVELICTRGCSATFSRDPREAINRFMVFVVPFSSVANPQQLERGLHIAISDRSRISPSSVDPTVKNYHWLDLVGGLYDAYDKQAETALLLDDRGNISEGPGFNVFMVKGQKLATPDYSVLLGVTRRSVMDICQLKGLECSARAVTAAELIAADEVFITSTAGGVMPVTKINQSSIGAGQVGPLTKNIMKTYWDKHTSDDWSMPLSYPESVK